MHQPRRLPVLFHRIFLSHLIVLLICFVSALILLDYLFVDGISHFLAHSTIILVPVLLALIGLVGLLALWTAGAAAIPLERATDALHSLDATEALERVLPGARIDEVSRLLVAIRARLDRGTIFRPLFLRLDRHWNVADCDIDTAARLGFTPEELRRRNLRALLAVPADFNLLRLAAEKVQENAASEAVPLRFVGAAGRILPSHCLLYQLPGDESLLIGIVGIGERR
jgi:hypothetical protein